MLSGPKVHTAERGAMERRNTDWNGPAVYALGFLTLISTFNYLDRTIFGLALPSIKIEMSASDTTLGLVSGFAFVLFYSILGLPIAWLADRWNRRNIIAIGFIFWSLMTAVTGIASNIWQLALARFLMGAGEATGIAPSNSMISDLFRQGRRPLALSIFGLASSLSSIFLFPLAGWIVDRWGWRDMFFAAGAPAILLGLLFFFTVKEPERGAKEARKSSLENASLGETIRFLMKSRTYLLLLGAVTFMGANLFAATVWVPTFLARVHGLSMGEIASTLGPLRGVLGAIGILAGGVLIDRWGRRDERNRLRIPALACILVAPAEVLFLLGTTRAEWVFGYGLTSFFTVIYQWPSFAVAMNMAKVRMRAMSSAIVAFFSSLVGQVVGPFLIGLFNDLLEPRFGELAIRYSMLILAVTAVIAGLLFWLAARTIVADNLRASDTAA
jgi:MFS family permease